MELIVTGNTKYFQSDSDSFFESIIMTGSITYDYTKSNVRIYKNNQLLLSCTFNVVNEIATKIRGCEYDAIQDILNSSGIMADLKNSSIHEKDLYKAFFNIIIWLEYSFLVPEESDIDSNIYNEFLIDYTGSPQPQKDIYFLPKNYLDKPELMNNLMNINLLNKLEVKLGNKKHVSYFIPFVKPGMKRELFVKNDIDFFSEWNKILVLRDNRIKEWFKNR